MCDRSGCPIAIEVFEGNTADPTTLTNQITKLKERFGIAKIIWVGDRGIISSTTIQKHFQTADRSFDWISARRAVQIRSLVEQESIQLSLFDEHNIAEISSEDYPGERLIACRNPMLATERAHTREELLQATEKELSKIVAATRQKKRLTGASNIALKVGKVVNLYKVAKHFKLDIQENSFSYERNTQTIDSEAALDGLYVIRTTVESEVLSATETVRAYKSLSQV
jgi:transposase